MQVNIFLKLLLWNLRTYNKLFFLGLSKKQYDRVKLHVTAMNTRFLEIGEEYNKNREMKKETFDATQILKVL